MPSVYSTSSNDIYYGAPKVAVDGTALPDRKVLIHGKATVSPGKGLHTPLGVRTEVTQDDLDFLMQDEFFKKHMDRGHIVVSGGKKEADDVAKDMQAYDGSSPKKVDEVIKKTSITPGGTASEIKKKASGK